jgi:hypothetical protein
MVITNVDGIDIFKGFLEKDNIFNKLNLYKGFQLSRW